MPNKFAAAVAAAAFAVLLAPQPAAAAKVPLPIFWGTAERIEKAVDLPQTPDFALKDGTHVDIGHKYKVVELFSIPLWDYEHTWVGYVGQSDKYLGLPQDKLAEIAKAANVALPASFTTPFWDAWGGKLTVAGLLAMLALWKISRRTA